MPIVLMDQGGDVMTVEKNMVGTLRAQSHGHEPIVLSENGTDRAVSVDITPPLKTTTVPCFALAGNTTIGQSQNRDNVKKVIVPTLTASNDPSRSPQSSEVTSQISAVFNAQAMVRRLTPIECERLQGFLDNYTKIPYRGKPSENCPDAPRYKALGNSWAVPVVRWIGERINLALKGL